jgi:hypothetical protein
MLREGWLKRLKEQDREIPKIGEKIIHPLEMIDPCLVGAVLNNCVVKIFLDYSY